MMLTDEGKEILKVQEGLRLTKYYDSKNIHTIGVGHNMRASPTFPDGTKIPDTITEEQAEALLKDDVEKHEAALFAQLPWAKDLDPVRRDVLINMCFNMGPSEFPHQWPNFAKQVREGEYKAAAANMLSTTWASQVGNRAKRLAALIKAGVY